MKKILLLGGSRYIIPVINAIHNLGYYAITCDYLPDNIAHKYSDEYHNVSITDENKVLELAKTLCVDGIMSFATDPGVVTAAFVAERLGLPSVGSYKAVSILQNKAVFRRFLADNGFRVPKAKGYSTYEQANMDIEQFKFPIIVKPVDSAGSKGVTRVDEISRLNAAIEQAIAFSQSKNFIIEEFIEKIGSSSDTDCFSIDGNLVFVSFNNQMFDNNSLNPYVPSAYSWPSNMPIEAQNELRHELQRLIKLLNLKTSIYNIETRLGTDGNAYIMEVSPRGGGNRLAEILRYSTGVDLITNAVRAAVGDSIIGVDNDPVYDGFWAEIILHSKENGEFKGLEIDERLEKKIVEKDLWITCGENVKAFTGANHAIGTLILRFDDANEMDSIMSNLEKIISVRIKK